MTDPLDTSTLGPIKVEPVTWAEVLAKKATDERFKCRLATVDQRNGYEVGYYEALVRNARQLGEMREAMQTFCDRVDRGEVRSKRTYAQFKELLA